MAKRGTVPAVNRKTKKAAWIMGGFAVGLALTWVALTPKKSPQLTNESLRSGKAVWAKLGPKSYEMTVQVSGVQSGLYEIGVDQGTIKTLLVDGETAEERIWKYWTVEGMFGFLEAELINSKNPAAVYGAVKDLNKVYLDALFDSQYGYPTKFLRQVTGRNMTIQWLVKSFIPLP